jgi:anti-anti-sigma factor
MTIQVDRPFHRDAAAVGAGWAPGAVPWVHSATMLEREHSRLSLFDARAEPTTSRLNLVGELDIDGGQRFRDVSGAILAGDPVEVVVDLARLRFIDASGIGLFVELRNELAARGTTLLILNADIRIARVFTLCGLNAMLTLPIRASGDSASLPTWGDPIGPRR